MEDTPTLEEMKEHLKYIPETGQFIRLTYKDSHPSKIAGSPNNHGYIRIYVLGRVYSAHRLAFFFTHGRWPDGEIDHINGDRRDNRIENLRECSRFQNIQNVRRTKANGVPKGVFWDKRFQKWQVQIRANGRKVHVGYFKEITEAEAAAIKARQELHGDFANHD